MKIQRHVWISGRVQGVGFRMSTAREAKRFSWLNGYVRNLPDGRVEAVFSGEENEVLTLVAWCRQGPPGAAVTDLSVREESVDSSLKPFGVDPTPDFSSNS